MARGSTPKNTGGGGPARIRLVILDAEVPDGDLSQLTTAVQNALRSPESVPSRKAIASLAPKTTPLAERADTDDSIDMEVQGSDEELESEAPTSFAPRASKPRKPPKTPKVIELDLTSDPSFEEFARSKNPQNDQKRFLVVAAWFKLCRNVDAITVEHVYTCYRAIKWPTAIADFAQPLRDLKGRQLLTSGAKGQYSINHLGLAEVDKLPASG